MTQVFFDPQVGGDGSTVSDDSSPVTGLARGGHRARFVPALVQLVAIAAWVKNRALDIVGYLNAAAGHASNAGASASSAAASSLTATQQAQAAAGSAIASQGYATLAQATNPDAPLRLNLRQVITDQTIPSGYNALSAGPLEITEGVTVTVSDNANWSIQ